MQKVSLSQEEIFFVAVVMNAKLGSVSFLEEGKKEILKESSKYKNSLIAKGYAISESDGNFILNDGVKALVNTCVNCEASIVIEQKRKGSDLVRQLYFVKNSLMLELQQFEMNNILIPIADRATKIDSILAQLELEWKVHTPKIASSVVLSNTILEKAKACLSKDEGVQVLIDGGCSNHMANIICDGLSDSTDFYGISTTLLKDAQPSKQDVIFINTENAILQISSTGTVPEQMVHFEAISSSQAHEITRKVLEAAFLSFID